MQIPIDQLPENVLRRVIEEYVSRDGTDWTDMEERIDRVLRSLQSGDAELHFDEETETTNIVAGDG